MLLVEELSLSCAPLDATAPRPPDIKIPVVAVTVAAASDATPRALLAVNKACFPERAVALLPTPATVSVLFSTAGPSECSSPVAIRSRPCTFPLHVQLVTESWVLALMEEEPAAAIADSTLVDPT